jgi:hypothetical protein
VIHGCEADPVDQDQVSFQASLEDAVDRGFRLVVTRAQSVELVEDCGWEVTDGANG